MPHRLAYLWHEFGASAAWISAVSGALGMVTADGLAAAITVVGLAMSVALVRLAKPVGDAIREVGFAWADVRGRMRKELTQVAVITQDNAAEIEAMKRQVVGAKAEADRKVAEAMARAAQVEKDATDKRHALAERLQVALASRELELMEAKSRIAALEATIGTTAESHAEAINTVSDTVVEVAHHLDPPLDVPRTHLDTNGERPDSPAPIPGGRP